MLFCLFLLNVILFILLLLKTVSYFLSEKVIISREELSSYECGFEHHNVSRIPFSLRYFYLTMIFLLFDLEIIFLLFSPVVFLSCNTIFSFISIVLFLLVLFLSLLYEWNDGTLEWLN